MGLYRDAAYEDWLRKNTVSTVVIYSALIVVLLPAFHYILGQIPAVPPDSLAIRLTAAAWSAFVAAALLLFAPLRKYATTLQFVNLVPVVVVIAMLTVNSGNHYAYVASGLLVIVGAQQAFYRAADLAAVMAIGFLFQAAYSVHAGIFLTPLNLVTLAIYGSAYVIAFIPAVLRIRIQQNEIQSRLEAQRVRAELDQREEALRRSRERLAEAHAMTNLGNWSRDLRTADMEWSPQLFSIFNLPPDTPPNAIDGLYERSIHPDDLDAVHARIEASEASHVPWSVDHRIVLADKSVRWVHLRGKYEYDETGTPIRRVGAVLDITRRKQAEESLFRLAQFDALTGLANRNALQERLTETLREAHAGQTRCAVLFLDLDRFKDINDTLGHALGDTLLRAVSERFSMMLPPGALLARWGGDEFVVLVPELSDPAAAVVFAERLSNVVAEPFYIENYELVVSVSIGIATFPADGADSHVLIRNADTAMYRAKEKSGARIARFEPSMHEVAAHRHRIQSELRRALTRDELDLYYQPIVETATGQIIGAEGLARWHLPDGSVRMPEDFIHIAEDSGLIVPVGTWALQRACSQIAAWQEAGITIVVSVNISARHFIHPEFLDTLAMVLRQTRIDPALLDIEITETALMSDAEAVLKVVREMQAMGIHLTIDDFGTGYSSFSYLKKFALNSLKLDYTFVSGIELPADRAIARSIVTIAHTLGMSVTAEGVENRTQFDILDDLRCDQSQGFYISRAMQAPEFERYYRAALASGAVERPARPVHKVSDLSERIPLRRAAPGG